MAHLRLRSLITGDEHRESFVSVEEMLERARRVDLDFYEILAGGAS